MISYTKRCVNFISLFFTIIIFLFLIFSRIYLEQKNMKHDFDNNLSKVYQYDDSYTKNIYFTQISLERIRKAERIQREEINIAKQRYEQSINMSKNILNKTKGTIVTKIEKVEVSAERKNIEKKLSKINIYRTNPWRIKIPKLGLDAPITEGTTSEDLRRTVGHFEGTTKWKGNVALAGHNRGYRCNFFQEIKELKKGDKIIYCTSKGKKEYKVTINKVIKETNWEYVKPSKQNKITLITCEKNRKAYRRCIQAVEI